MKTTALFIVLAMLAACSGISVTKDWDPSIDFSQFQTFTVLEDGEQPINRLTDQRIRAAIVAELASRGLQQVFTPEEADLAIGYQVTSEQRTSYQTIHSGWGASGFHTSRLGWGGSMGTSQTIQFNYTVGTLIIAAFQMSNEELVWEGSGSGTVDAASGPEQGEQRINDAVQQILESFPPRVGPTKRESG